MAATGEIYSEKQINYPTGGNMLFEYTGLSGSRIGASFIQPETTTNHDGRPPDSLPRLYKLEKHHEDHQDFRNRPDVLAGRAPPPTPRPTSNRTTCRSRASTARRMKARAAPRCRPSWPRGRRQGGRPVWNVEPTTRPSPASTALRTTAPAAPRSKPIWPAPRSPAGVERRTQRHAVLRRLSRRMSHRRAPPASPRNEQPSPCCISPPAVPGGILPGGQRPASKRITGTWPRSRQV